MKKMLVYLLAVAMVASLVTGCTPKTPNDDKTFNPKKPNAGREPIPLNILTVSRFETEANVVRDQLTKAGFDVTLNVQPDYSSCFAQADAGNFDALILSWRTLTGSPDYAAKPLFSSTGDSNEGGFNNSEADKLIDIGASTIGDESIQAYKKLEKLVVEDEAYHIPVVRMMAAIGFNNEIVNSKTISVCRSGYLKWQDIDYNDVSLRDLRPLVVSTNTVPGQFDPLIQDGTWKLLHNSNIRLMNLTDDDQLTYEGSLCCAYAVAEGNASIYFVLKDNVNFAKVENKKAVDTGIKVSADDVIFTVERLMDKNSVPNHSCYTNYEKSIRSVTRVTNLAELEAIKPSGENKTLKIYLEEILGQPITKLAADENEVDNKNGSFEIVKMDTYTPFPQLVNLFCTFEAGVVSKDQVSKINTFDVLKYNPSKDIRYGDPQFLRDGSDYDNQLYFSGPYAITYFNDYEIFAEKNPGYMPGTDEEAKIDKVITKIVTDNDASVSALRSGEIDICEDVPPNQVKVIQSSSNLGVCSGIINGVVHLSLNLNPSKVTANIDIRKAILYAIDQNGIINVKDGMGATVYSALMLNTGNEIHADPAKVREHLDNYYKSIGK